MAEVPLGRPFDLDFMSIASRLHGPKQAAWLVRRFKKSIRANGAFIVDFDWNHEVPPWFELGIACFRRKPHAAIWHVTLVERSVGGVRYIVRWRLWPHRVIRSRKRSS